jgi:hypothetical protein
MTRLAGMIFQSATAGKPKFGLWLKTIKLKCKNGPTQAEIKLQMQGQ